MTWYSEVMNWLFGGPAYTPKVYSVRVRAKDWSSWWIRATDKNVDNYTALAEGWNGLYGAGTHTLEFEYREET